MSGTPLNPTRLVGLMSTAMKTFPIELLTDEVCQSWEDNGEELARRMMFLAEMAPEPKRKRKSKQSTFDEAAFFQTRLGLYVDPDLKRYVGLQTRTMRGAAALKQPRVLTADESEATMFGNPNSEQYRKTLENAPDLGQIAGKIEAQWDGKVGELLTDGQANIFPTRGLDGALRVVRVRRGAGEWHVFCFPFNADNVWLAGYLVFSN